MTCYIMLSWILIGYIIALLVQVMPWLLLFPKLIFIYGHITNTFIFYKKINHFIKSQSSLILIPISARKISYF